MSETPNIVGLPPEAEDYILKNSYFIHGATIGCKKSDGVINKSSTMYHITEVTIKNKIIPILLFKHTLSDGTECYEEIENVIGNDIYIQLRVGENKVLAWNKNIFSEQEDKYGFGESDRMDGS